jgi:hypothetical protein
MDDLIYILMLVAWVAYSIYNAKQKKKQKELQNRPAAEPQPNYEPEQTQKPQRSIFEEVFGEGQFEDFEETIEEEVPHVEETRKVPAEYTYYKPEPMEVLAREEYITASQLISDRENELVDIDLIDKPITYGNYFNLRKAVIYSAILERPYH